jgi:error-prone DNA polymerase
VVHVVTERLEDLSGLLRSVGERDEAFPLTHGRGDGVTHPCAPDLRDSPGLGARPSERPVRDGDVHHLHPRPGSGIRVPTRDFR